jgi:hypothetical protein
LILVPRRKNVRGGGEGQSSEEMMTYITFMSGCHSKHSQCGSRWSPARERTEIERRYKVETVPAREKIDIERRCKCGSIPSPAREIIDVETDSLQQKKIKT